ncbi:hypothetical protein [Aestuariivirga sp.]|uniref:hypothetical protein n=1 Tax=Aestuariivirga sp. TaxID=2650926 RepID=UPI0025B9BBCE|nr:hypothetical protein [Aestuariivirga sp.]MCA3554261.1 hypothetical protein [Aestuariivirga sp.]
MSGDSKRLLRLARAQADLTRLLEGKIAAERQCQEEFRQTRLDTLSALEQVSAAGLVFYPAALRRLCDIDASIAASEREARALAARLLMARGREDVLLRRAGEAAARRQRHVAMEEGREAALAMAEKAPGKPGVVK